MQRPIDPVTLRLFVAVCEEGHIARAVSSRRAGRRAARRCRDAV